MAKDIIGIDISDASIEAVVLEGKKNSFKLDSYARLRLDPGIVKDGNILHKDNLRAAIKKLLASAKPKPITSLRSKKVWLSVPESKTYSHVLTLPKKLKDKEIFAVSEHKAEEFIPETIDNLISAIKVIPSKDSYKQIFFTAANADIVEDFVEVFKGLDMEVVGITTEALSSYAGISDKLKKKTTLMLDLGSRTTIASIFDEHGLRDTINIRIAGNKITKTLTTKLHISEEEAEKQKREVGLDSSVSAGETMLIIQGQFQPLTDELKKFISYYEKSYGKKIEQIVLVGGLANMRGIDKYFGENLNLEVFKGEPFLDKKTIPEGVAATNFINALGLARLAHGKPEINFFKGNIKNKFKKKTDDQVDGQSTKDKTSKSLSKFKFDKSKINFSILKNPYILSGIALVIVAVLLFSFWDKLFGGLEDTKHIYNQDIIVSLQVQDDVKNSIVGQNILLLVEEERIHADLTYENIISNLQSRQQEEIFALTSTVYQKEGYYVIPQLVTSDIIMMDPLEEDFIINESIKTQANYVFIEFNEEDIKNVVLSELPEKQAIDLVDWTLQNGQYEIISYNPQALLFNIKATIELHRTQ